MASIRKAKKQAKKEGRVFINPNRATSLYKQVQREIKEVNKRLRALEKSGNYNSYSSKKLFERLGSKKYSVLNKSKKVNRGHILGIKLRKNMSNTDLAAVSKASNQFLRSATSTPKKLKKVVEQTKKSMYETLKAQDKDISKEDIETYYEMLGNKDFDYFNEKVGASSTWAAIEDAIEEGDNQDQFIKRLNNMNLINVMTDQDAKAKAIRLYEKYIL